MGERVKVEVGQRRRKPDGQVVRVIARNGMDDGPKESWWVRTSGFDGAWAEHVSTVERWPVIPAVGTEGEG